MTIISRASRGKKRPEGGARKVSSAPESVHEKLGYSKNHEVPSLVYSLNNIIGILRDPPSDPPREGSHSQYHVGSPDP